MAAVMGLHGYNSVTAANDKILAAYGNDIVDLDTGLGFGLALNPASYVEFATYLDHAYACNYTEYTLAYNGTSWLKFGESDYVRCPKARYLKRYKTRLYLANVSFNSMTYPSRVYYTGLPYNNKPRWELEWGTDLTQTADSAVVNSPNAHFLRLGIKVGDTFYITTGANAGEYHVASVDSDRQITLVDTLTNTASNSSFWVGSNWLDVATDDGDYIRGLGSNSDRLLIFKLNSLHRYNGTELFQVGDYPGTSSHRSIANVNAYTYYFHGSETTRTGIYIYDGTGVVKASAAIQPYIDGISSTIYSTIVGWREGDWYRCYVGDISNTQRNLSVTKAVLSHNSITNKWSIDPIADTIYSCGSYIELGAQLNLIGTADDEVHLTPSGYSYNGATIPWVMETGTHYPEGSESINRFTRIQIIARDADGVRVRYKLVDAPDKIDDNWLPLGELDGDKTELDVPLDHNWASGINIRCEDNGLRENTLYIEKITLFYTYETTKMP